MNFKGQVSGINRFLGIFIAVVIIAGMLFFSVRLYNLRTSNLESENARKLLDNIVGKIDILKDGESGEFAVRGVEGWYLIGFDKNEEGRPDKCFFDGCICICPEGKETCQTKGFCRTLKEDNVNVSSYIKYNFNYLHRFITNGEMLAQCIVLPKALINLPINKSENSVSIFYNYGIFINSYPSGEDKWIGGVPDSLSQDCGGEPRKV